MKLSKHSKLRLRERTDYNHKERRQLFKDALKYGKTFDQIKDEKIKKFIKDRTGKCKVKLYKDYVFIYSKNSHLLYTMYALPKELKAELND